MDVTSEVSGNFGHHYGMMKFDNMEDESMASSSLPYFEFGGYNDNFLPGKFDWCTGGYSSDPSPTGSYSLPETPARHELDYPSMYPSHQLWSLLDNLDNKASMAARPDSTYPKTYHSTPSFSPSIPICEDLWTLESPTPMDIPPALYPVNKVHNEDSREVLPPKSRKQSSPEPGTRMPSSSTKSKPSILQSPPDLDASLHSIPPLKPHSHHTQGLPPSKRHCPPTRKTPKFSSSKSIASLPSPIATPQPPVSLTTILSPTKSSSNSQSPKNPTKTNHNDIERHYRDRLNNRFEDLMQALHICTEGKGKMSKGQILVLAKARIELLEKEGEMLEDEGKALMDMLDGMTF